MLVNQQLIMFLEDIIYCDFAGNFKYVKMTAKAFFLVVLSTLLGITFLLVNFNKRYFSSPLNILNGRCGVKIGHISFLHISNEANTYHYQ